MEKSKFKTNISCHFCQLSPLCTPQGLTEEEQHELQKTIDQHYVLEKGKILVYPQDPLQYLYALRTGSAKGWITTLQGQEKIIDFYFPGEIIGLEALEYGRHNFTVMSLENSTICRLNYPQLTKAMDQYPKIRAHLLKLASHKLNERGTLLYHQDAEARLLAFLQDTQQRLQIFKLSMSRVDIANYLNLTPETVSRLFTRLKKKDLIELQGSRFKLL